MSRLFSSVLAFGLFAGLSLSATAEEPLPLATGEFAPYTGALLPGYGVTSQIVKQAFKAAGYDTVLVFLPWRRAMKMTANSRYVGSFPWAKNAEREQLYLYSEPLSNGRIRFFAKLSAALDHSEGWQGRTLCVPDGWDTSTLQAKIDQYQLQLVRPSDLESCFRMLGAGRLELVAVNEDVGQSTLRRLGDLGEPIVPVGADVVGIAYHLIVSRDYPGAEKLIGDFNAGLQSLKQDGSYNKLLESAAKR